MKLLFMQLPQFFSSFMSLGSQYSPQHSVLEHPTFSSFTSASVQVTICVVSLGRENFTAI
jgi:hypothetical protein